MSGHRVIRASAGTGKTYALAHRLIALLAEGAEPDQILAATFARRAAGQILDRVVGHLVDATQDAVNLTKTTGCDIDEARAFELLKQVLTSLDRLQIRTLDSCFAQLGRLVALEAGWPAGWGIVEKTEDKALRAAAVSALIQAGAGADLQALVADIADGSARRAIHDALFDAVDRAHNAWLDTRLSGGEPQAGSGDAAWERLEVPPGLSEAEVTAAAAWLDEDFQMATTAKGELNKSWVKARDELQAALLEEGGKHADWGRLTGVGLLGQMKKGVTDYYGKDFAAEDIDRLGTLLTHARHVLLGRLRARHVAHRDLTARFDAIYRAAQVRRGSFRFEDVPRALEGVDALGEAQRNAAFFRLGAPLVHLLLDEFQDTSTHQWRVLAPLAEAVMGDETGERTFFCVGDAKQSIYGWRAGEPAILARIFEEAPPGWRDDLVDCWRSSPVVLDAVDAVFGDIVSNAVWSDTEDEDAAAAAAAWAEDYVTVKPAATLKDRAGHATMIELDAGRAWEDALADHIAALVEAAPNDYTFGVLLRENRRLGRLILALRHRGVLASGEGGNALCDSDAVNVALSALHLADHPGDTFARFHVETSPLADVVLCGEDAPAASARIRLALTTGGFGIWLAGLKDAVDAGFGVWDSRRFGQLVELGHRWDHRARGQGGAAIPPYRPGAFNTWAREERVEDPAAANVKVMTVHGAKGAEFDVVVLPELGKPLHNGRPEILTERPDRTAPHVTAACPGVTKDLAALDGTGFLGGLRSDWIQDRIREELCVLYVAMTRAKRRLDLIVEPARKGAPKQSFRRILLAALGVDPDAECDGGPVGALDDHGGRVLWVQKGSSVDWAKPLETSAADKTQTSAPAPLEPLPERLDFAAPERPRQVRRDAPSAREGGGSRTAADILAGGSAERDAALQRGTLVHAWMELVEWPNGENGDPSEEALLAKAAEIGVTADFARLHLAAFTDALADPEIRAALSRTAHGRSAGADVSLWRERRFAVHIDGVHLSGAFDRVVIERQGGEPVAAEIIDFKTDVIGDDDALQTAVAHYAPQMFAYRDALCSLTHLDPSAVRLTLLFLDPHRAATVDGP